MDTKPKKKSFDWLNWVSLAFILTVLVAVILPMRGHSSRKPKQTEAVSNLRQIGFALLEFESQYGAYPNDETAAKVVTKTKTDLDLAGASSNTLFRQLFATGIVTSEGIFHAKVEGAKKPDGVISAGKALAPGEVAFGYIAGLSASGNPARPIAFCPIIPGTDRFDPEPFDGKAVVLLVDNSVRTLNIDGNGHAMLGPQNILSPKNPIWDGQAPDIRYPE